MKNEISTNYKINNLDLLEELYDLFDDNGNIYVIAFFRTINKSKVYYDFQLIDQPLIKGSYDKLETLEFIYYLEDK